MSLPLSLRHRSLKFYITLLVFSFSPLYAQSSPDQSKTQKHSSQETPKKDQTHSSSKSSIIQLSTTAEFGMLVPLSHTIQFDKQGTLFDYVEEGGQDNAFPFVRLEAGMKIKNRHHIQFLYQPLNLESQVYIEEDLIVDQATFPANSGVDLRYGFDFYRISYLYDLWHDDPKNEFSIGGSLQLRNATINFTSSDGLIRRTNRNMGPVPLLKLRWISTLDKQRWFGLEADGFYAPIKYINGSDSDVEGAIIDLSLRYGIKMDQSKDLFFNLRWIGGGGEGTSSNDDGPGDGFSANWLNLLSFSIGITWSPHSSFH